MARTISKDPAEKTTITLPASVKLAAQVAANANHRSFSAWVTECIRKELAVDKFSDLLPIAVSINRTGAAFDDVTERALNRKELSIDRLWGE